MKRYLGIRRTAAVLLTVVFACTTVLGQSVPRARDDCQYDRSQASFETALNFYGGLDWTCTIDVLGILLARDQLDEQQTCESYFLLAAATYQYRTESGQAPDVIQDTVVTLAARGFLAKPDWSGPYYSQVPQYLNWIEEGRALAESGALTRGRKIHNWWQAALLTVGTVGVITFISSSVTSEKEAPLPGFPEPPGGGK